MSWTQALRTIVKNCYKQHGREDLLYAFEDQVTTQQVATTATHSIAHLVPSQTVVQTISNPDGTVSLIQVSSGPSCGNNYTVVFDYSIYKIHWMTSFRIGGDKKKAKLICNIKVNMTSNIYLLLH